MEQQIVLMIDGTNCGGLFDRTTNIRRLFTLACEDRFQHRVYLPGPGCVSRNKFKRMISHFDVKGLRRSARRTIHGWLWGGDMDRILINAYTKLAEWYRWGFDESVAPRIFIFGFSRGACIARKLCEMVTECGIPINGKIAEQVVIGHRKKHIKAINVLRSEKKLSKPVEVSFLGLWDSVNASLRSFRVGKWIPSRVLKCRHALAKHEYRQFYRHHSLSGRGVDTLVFPGCHSDVGGGYKDSTVLSDISFDWMMDGAIRQGLFLNSDYIANRSHDISGAKIHSENNDITNLLGAFGYYERKFKGIQEHDSCPKVESMADNANMLREIRARISAQKQEKRIHHFYRAKSIRLYLKFTKIFRELIDEHRKTVH